MVIAIFDAAVANSAMGCTGRAPETACRAVFGGYVLWVIDVFALGGDGDFTRGGKEMPVFGGFGGEHV
jgi:hypothetical protein